MDILLKNALIVTQNENRDIFKGDVLIQKNRIAAVEKSIQKTDVQQVDLDGLVLLPGLIQTHVHLCQALFRNLADDLELIDWLEKRIWPMEMAHNEDSLRASARLGLFELMSCGATTILDMGNGNHMEVIFQEIEQSGMRAFSGKVMMDYGEQPYKEETETCLKTTEALIQRWHQAADGRIQYALAPRFVLSCSDALWEGIKHLSEKYSLLIHSHSSENRQELEMVRARTGYNNVEFFVKKGLASARLALAHCIWITEKELEYLADYRINVMHCPSANLKLGSGFAPIPKMLKKGVNVSLGSDGAPCNNNLDIFVDMRLAALIHKPTFGVASISAGDVLDMVTRNAARTLGMEDSLGSIEPGKLADLTVLNLNKVHAVPADNVISQIVYSAQSRDVVHVMVNGEWIVYNQKPLKFDEQEVVEEAWRQCNLLLQRL